MKRVLVLPLLILAFGFAAGSEVGKCDAAQYSAGDTGAYRVSGVSFNLRYVPSIRSFPLGEDDAKTGSVGAPYWIAETETTYRLWKVVLNWAVSSERGDKKYSFANLGAEGSHAKSDQEPVTCMGLRDAVVWCNALTEYYNAINHTNMTCVYRHNGGIIRNAKSNIDVSDATSTANGFRLPTGNEWELAARYINDNNNDGKLNAPREYYPGNFASGADSAVYETSIADFDQDGDIQDTYDLGVYSTGSTAPVKSKYPNKLGIYDLTGNVCEWCFTKVSSNPARWCYRGGWWAAAAEADLHLGSSGSGDPAVPDTRVGFRIAGNAQ